MVWLIFIAFIAVPALEIALFIQIGGWLGLFPTLAIVFLTAAAGTALLRQQGFEVLSRAQANMDAGELPVREVFDGLCLFLAGALLLTPGFFTDGVGFLLFLPPFRAFLMATVVTKIIANANIHVHRPGGHPNGPGPHGPHGGQHHGHPRHPGPGGPIIDGDYSEVPDQPDGYIGPEKNQKRD